MFLAELTQNVGRLRGVGPAAVRDLANLGVFSVGDLLRHYPRDYEDRQTPVSLAESIPGRPANTVAEVVGHDRIRWKKGLALKVLVEDDTSRASLLCFGRNFLADKLPVGAQIYLTGDFELRFGELQTGQFTFEPWTPEPREFGRILPIYPLSGTLSQATLRRAVSAALQEYLAGLRNEIPPSLAQSRGIPPKAEQLRSIHFPESIETAQSIRRALIFEELFQLQTAVARRALSTRPENRRARPWSRELIERFLRSLTFTATPDQERSLSEIEGDIQSPRVMARLLQGEVGSGKTLVALVASLGVIGAGRQAVIMAPTELLARQHAENASRLLEPLGVRVAYLSGEVTGEGRRLLLDALAAGEIDLALGTHALFSHDVVFGDLALAVVDEQHRFGVQQRQALMEKGNRPDLLLMSATPIPRTLALTAFGDLDVSVIKTMPPGRLPVETHLARMGNEAKVYDFVRRELAAGHRAYFVYPLIEETGRSSLKDAETMYRQLKEEVFPEYALALIHSRIDEETKRDTMRGFQDGKIVMLVATSVVEVGVDVPEATCMVVEHAERFGLSALHQLRGRVGRGSDPAFCFLVYAEPLTDDGKHRMKTMKETRDGFQIAEEDLKLRGPGDMAGTRQSGFLRLRIADPVRDLDLLIEARDEAKNILGRDPGWIEPENRDLRELWSRVPPFDPELVATG